MERRQSTGGDGGAPDRRTVMLSGLFATAASAVPARAATASAGSVPRARTAAATEGPYYRRLDLIRSDIAEGLSGVPLDLCFTVVDDAGRACTGLRVDVWHCDASGRYSGFAEPGTPPSAALAAQTFLRGTQIVDATGVAAFRTIYPGWYRGRTTHIHFKLLSAKGTVLTSQFFLPDALSEFLYVSVPEYRRDAVRDTLNSTDGIAIAAGETVHGSVREAGDRYLANLAIRVDPASVEADAFAGPPGGVRPGGPPMMGGARPGDRPPPPPGFGPPGFGPPPAHDAPIGLARIAALLPDAPRRDGHGPGRG